jgi:hypothetical protein
MASAPAQCFSERIIVERERITQAAVKNGLFAIAARRRLPRLRSATKKHARPQASGAKAALIVFLNVIHNFLRNRAFAPASECYAGDDSNIVGLRLVCMPLGRPSAQFSGG